MRLSMMNTITEFNSTIPSRLQNYEGSCGDSNYRVLPAILVEEKGSRGFH